jgi:hypothetical protein
MKSFRSPFCRFAPLLPAFLFAATLTLSRATAQTIPSADAPPAQEAPPPPPDDQRPQPPPQPPTPLPPPPPFDKALFLNPVPAPALAFLTQFDGAPSGDL